MDRPEIEMDLEELAKQMDDATAEALESLNDGAGNVGSINSSVAKSVSDWAALMGEDKSTVYNMLTMRVAEGTWKRVAVNDRKMRGRAMFYYYQTGKNPFL